MKLETLDKLIPQYAANKSELDGYKKICDKENAQIKAIMSNLAVQHYEAGEYKASYSIQKRESVNEEMLLEIIHSHEHECNVSSIIKTKEYIDFDALENAIYNGLIPEDVVSEMGKATEVKEVPVLKVTKLKEKE